MKAVCSGVMTRVSLMAMQTSDYEWTDLRQQSLMPIVLDRLSAIG